MLILTLDEAKSFLRVDNNDEDSDIQGLICASELYLKNATSKNYNSSNALAKLYCRVLVVEWYDDRNLMELNKTTEKVRFTLQSILLQLQYCEA